MKSPKIKYAKPNMRPSEDWVQVETFWDGDMRWIRMVRREELDAVSSGLYAESRYEPVPRPKNR